MKRQRKGTDLKIEIRILRSLLGMDVHARLPRTIAELEAERRRLAALRRSQQQ